MFADQKKVEIEAVTGGFIIRGTSPGYRVPGQPTTVVLTSAAAAKWVLDWAADREIRESRERALVMQRPKDWPEAPPVVESGSDPGAPEPMAEAVKADCCP